MTGYPKVNSYSAKFSSKVENDQCILTWALSFNAEDAPAAVDIINLISSTKKAITVCMAKYFSPKI